MMLEGEHMFSIMNLFSDCTIDLGTVNTVNAIKVRDRLASPEAVAGLRDTKNDVLAWGVSEYRCTWRHAWER